MNELAAPDQNPLEERVRRQGALIAAQDEQIRELLAENEELKQQNEDLKKQLFGSTSEKLDPKKMKLAAEAVKEEYVFNVRVQLARG